MIPTVSWGDENTFSFCFAGIPKGSTVAVSTYMVSEHGHHADQKDFFMKGYRELLRRIEPERIICYNEPFPEMEGNIVYVNYELSSWKYQNEAYTPSKYLPYICGERPLPIGSDLRIKSGYVLRDNPFSKGMGSAYGGKWKPAKPGDERFLGRPGEIKKTTIHTSKGSYEVETKIGPDGKATKERHKTDHGKPWFHTDPHDHEIDWSQGFPHPKPPTNYPDGEPDFKHYAGGKGMSDLVIFQTPETNRFTSISDFKMCMRQGGEVQFEWKGIDYCCFGCLCQNPGEEPRMMISRSGPERGTAASEMWGDTADDILEYMVGDDRLRDVITQVVVFERTI